MTRWNHLTGGHSGEEYARRIEEHLASGEGVHGEADLCQKLLPDGGSVLDAGCGTGRVAFELNRRGYECVGVDLDESMLRVARRMAPEMRWVTADLSSMELGVTFDLVLCAGNVVPLLAAGTEPMVILRLAAHLDTGGLLLCGFGLDPAHLPIDDAPVDLSDYDDWCESAGLELVDRWSTWEQDPFDRGGYHVSLHRRSDQPVARAK